MKKNRSQLYTKTGDRGRTALIGGIRVSKTSPRIEAYGTVDELNSFVGNLRAHLGMTLEQDELLAQIQHRLFCLGAYLATDNLNPPEYEIKCGISPEDIKRVEEEIDRLDSSLPALKAFVLPAGGVATSAAHICRTITRRAERRIYQLLEEIEGAEVDKEVLQYVNRLSDYFFVLARAIARQEGGAEVVWVGCN